MRNRAAELSDPGSEWELAEIRDGIPVVVPATSEEFVPQMLNLDQLGGIAFDKGCYTGQEVVARTHYLGSVKRRMHRFRAAALQAPTPGDRLIADDETPTPGQVIRSAIVAGTTYELLAVIPERPSQETRYHLQDAQGPSLELLT